MLSATVSSLMQLVLLAGPTPPANYEEAYHQSLDTGRPLVVLVGTDWCPACQQMKNNVIPQMVQDGSMRKVAFATVNADQERGLADQLMSGGSIPQVIMFHKTNSGWKRTQLTGAQAPSTLNAMFEKGAKESTGSAAE
jgi:thioredoxin-like negative regulator of GroEL